MTSTNQNLDLILNNWTAWTKHFQLFLHTRIEQLEAKFNSRIETIELSLKDKINFDEMEDIQERLEKLEDHK